MQREIPVLPSTAQHGFEGAFRCQAVSMMMLIKLMALFLDNSTAIENEFMKILR